MVRVFRVDISREYLRQNKKRKPRTRFLFSWCGRQELKTYDDKKKALIFKAFLLLNANVDAKIFEKIKAPALIVTQKQAEYGAIKIPWRFTYLVNLVP